MPSIGIYRPPAARRLEEQSASPHEREQIADSVNGKHECKCPSEVDEQGRRSDASGVSMFRNAITSIKSQNGTEKSKSGETEKKEVVGGKARQRRPDMKMYVPKGRRLANELGKTGDKNAVERGTAKNDENGVIESTKSDVIVISERLEGKCVRGEHPISDGDKCEVRTCQIVPRTPSPVIDVPPSSLWIEAQNEGYEEEKEEKIISSQSELNGSGNCAPETVKVSPEKTCDKKIKLNPEECDWESMFDDTGECLDPSLIEQLSSAVGSVTIEKPKSNYEPFKTKSLDMVSSEFPHVIEIYNFPPEFRLQDLMTVFSQFKNAGFDIKWVDDTHALGIFGNSQIVSEVLALRHPFVKTRMLKDGTPLSKEKARRSAEHLLPYKPRPDTCPALARRLVTGALGVKLKTSREEREAERKILKEAREKKRLEAKQREEAWEGNFT